ncbi:MAG: nuclear transport factor 2 family protein, partial [Gemmatimonadota bacterium]|nr:nuclear transport factor 2 family protein [Gemmatimonadota bacterium]
EGNVLAVLAAMDPAIEWNEAENFPYADGNPYVGPQAVVEGVFARLGSEWDYWNLAIEDVLDAGDRVIALGRYRAKHAENGREIDAQFAHVWTLRDSKAVRFQQYADTAQVRDAVEGG